MKKFYLVLLALLMTACTTKATSVKETAANTTGNYTDEMKIEDNEDLDPEAGQILWNAQAITKEVLILHLQIITI